jgi:prepilin-type N-terminal cleavage/methylation domain-containing protein
MKKNLLTKIRNRKGFTLAELLIVVAIIGVLVAISIPIFTSQLEKARRATTQANLRSAYAEASAALLTNDTGSIATGDVTVSVTSGAGTVVVKPVDIETVTLPADDNKLPFKVTFTATGAKKDAEVTFTVANGAITEATVK